MRLRAVWEFTGLCPSSDGHVASVATDASVGTKTIIGNLTTRDMWRASERRTLDAASVAMATDAYIAPEKHLVKGKRLYSFVGAINRRCGQPWLGAKHTLALVAYVVVLGSPLTHSYLIVFIRSSERAILVRLHREIASCGTRCSCCKSVVLVTLGGCHLLDGLVACGFVEARKKIVRSSGEAL
jgi:hypothetical protein